MPRDYSATELIASIRQRSFTAGAPRDFDDASVLRLLNELATSYLLKLIAKRRTNYLVESVDLAVTAASSSYQVPSVAIAGAVRAVTLIVGNQALPMLAEVDLPQGVQMNATPGLSAFPSAYYWQGPNIVLTPAGAYSGTLRVHYHRRPSVIVLPSACIKVTSLPGGAANGFYRVGFASAPSGYVNGVLVDVVSNIPNFYRWQTGAALSNVTGTTADIPGSIPAGLAVGDWVCLYDTAPVVTDSPAEVVTCLLQAVVVGMLEGKGADESLARAEKGLARAEDSAGPLIQQRNTGAQRKISAFPDAAAWPWMGG